MCSISILILRKLNRSHAKFVEMKLGFGALPSTFANSFFDPTTPSMRKGRDGGEKTGEKTGGEKNDENSGHYYRCQSRVPTARANSEYRYAINIGNNTSLLAPEALIQCLQRCTACNT